MTKDAGINPEWWAEFEAASVRPFELHMKSAFIRTCKPVLDDAPYRSFETTAEHRKRCNENVPKWLGYGTDWLQPGRNPTAGQDPLVAIRNRSTRIEG